MGKHCKAIQLFQLIDRKKFDSLVNKWGMDKGVRHFDTKKFTQILIASVALGIESYRGVELVFGVSDSTFGDALRMRCSGFFHELCNEVLKELKERTKDRRVRAAIKNLLAIDSTDCSVHGSLFSFESWRKKKAKGCKASVKLHTVWAVGDDWIEDFRITAGTKSDVTTAKQLKLSGGNIYALDRAYVDLTFWLKIVEHGSDFVTRLKRAPRKEALHKAVLSEADYNRAGVLWEGKWTPSATACLRNNVVPKTIQYRQIIYRDPNTGRIFDFLTSNWELTAQEIADIYKRRWSVELLFRWLKGHLNIRYLPVKTKNAVRTQLAVAVLVQLLVQLKKVTESLTETAWSILKEIRFSPFREILMDKGSPPWDDLSATPDEGLGAVTV